MKKTVGFFGCGNMGSAILSGIRKARLIASRNIWVLDKEAKKNRQLQRTYGIRIADSPRELAQRSQILFLGIKPQQISEAAASLKPYLTKRHIIVSILAGTTLKRLENLLGQAPRLVRVMPNLGAMAGESFSVLSSSDPAALRLVKPLLEACGITAVAHEKFLNAVTALSGSGPAYVFYLMEFLEKAAQRAGLPLPVAKRLAVQTVYGASRVAKGSLLSPLQLRQRVTSKGGTTEAAFKILEKRGFQRIFLEAVRRAEKRAKELSR
jgi:pyrroline-5-carboxylate reductase